MRKTVKILLALLFSTVTTGSIIACANPFVDPNVFRITVVTDGHTIADHSFNESAYNAAFKFKSEFEQWIADPTSNAPEDLRNKSIVVTPIQPPTTELNSFLQSYGQSVVMNSKVTIASGFIQNSALVSAQNNFLRNKMRYIYIDGDTPTNEVSVENKDLAGLLYKAEQSGLLAAIAAGTWLIAHAADYGNNLHMSTYGGLNIPAVTSLMYGFYWGIDLINNSQTYNPTFNQTLKNWVKILNPDFDLSQPLPHINFVGLENQFTGNFDQASPSSKALNDSLVSQGSNVIFPVAGPQTSDTISALQSKSSNGKIVGVDTDQALQYPGSIDYFLTSALKDIVSSVSITLWQAFGFDATTHEKLSDEQMNQIFKGNASPQGGPGYTGIADNKPINPIYESVISDTVLQQFADNVSNGWQNVLANSNGDFWNYGKTLNPFTLSMFRKDQ